VSGAVGSDRRGHDRDQKTRKAHAVLGLEKRKFQHF
jgi:hypothetical protein